MIKKNFKPSLIDIIAEDFKFHLKIESLENETSENATNVDHALNIS